MENGEWRMEKSETFSIFNSQVRVVPESSTRAHYDLRRPALPGRSASTSTYHSHATIDGVAASQDKVRRC
jgi:hypothetical protein